MPEKEYLCSACEWTGKGEALIECPICGKDLTELTAIISEKPLVADSPEKYDPEKLKKIHDEDNVEDL